MDDEQKARNRDDRLPEFGKNIPGQKSASRWRVASSWTEERASSVGGKLRFTAQRPRAGRGMSKNILPSPLSAYPTAAEISLSLEARRAQLGQAEEAGTDI